MFRLLLLLFFIIIVIFCKDCNDLTHNTIVIGCGLGGLSISKRLLDRGVKDVACFGNLKDEDNIGGVMDYWPLAKKGIGSEYDTEVGLHILGMMYDNLGLGLDLKYAYDPYFPDAIYDKMDGDYCWKGHIKNEVTGLYKEYDLPCGASLIFLPSSSSRRNVFSDKTKICLSKSKMVYQTNSTIIADKVVENNCEGVGEYTIPFEKIKDIVPSKVSAKLSKKNKRRKIKEAESEPFLVLNLIFKLIEYFPEQEANIWNFYGYTLQIMMGMIFDEYKTEEILYMFFPDTPDLRALLYTATLVPGEAPVGYPFSIEKYPNMLFWLFYDDLYYIRGSTKYWRNTLISSIISQGGHVCSNKEVDKLIIDSDKKVTGVIVKNKEYISEIVITTAGFNQNYKRFTRDVSEELGYNAYEPKVTEPWFYFWFMMTGHPADYYGVTNSGYLIYTTPYWGEKMLSYSQMEEFDPNVLPPYILAFPSLRNKEWQDEHPNTLEMTVVSATNFKMFSKWNDTDLGKRGEEYYELKRKITDQVFGEMKKIFPNFNLEIYKSGTPLTMDSYTMKGPVGCCGISMKEFYPYQPERTAPYISFKMPGLTNIYVAGNDAPWGCGTSMVLTKSLTLSDLFCIEHPTLCSV